MDTAAAPLPVPPTPLIGREALLAELRERLQQSDSRLVTLAGPPGVGKTRLALQLAAELSPAFADRAHFVALESLRDPGLVAATVARAVGLREEEGFGNLETKLQGYLREKQLLLVLDNLEHVLDAAGLVADLLAVAPGLKVLVTSRVILRLSGEQEFPVPPLDLPGLTPLPSLATLAGNPAVALFVARARAVRPDLDLTMENARVIAQVCHRLDGIPLAIELAAARSKLFSPQALLSRLDQRFAVLKGGARDLPERQQSLHAALDWSYDLLKPEERRLLRRTAIFAGGFTLEAVQAVGNPDGAIGIDIADGLEALLDQSLLQSKARAHGDLRFSMLDSIREYALERLRMEDAPSGMPRTLRQHHALYFVRLAEAAESHLRGAEQPQWLGRLEAEHDNLRAVLAWSLESQDGELGWRLAGALWEFWLMHGHLSEARRWLEAVLALPGLAGPARAKALCGAGVMARFQGDFVSARARLAESEALWRTTGDAWGLADALTYLGTVDRYVGDPRAGRTHLDESLVLWRQLGDRWGLALALSARAGLANDEGDYQGARTFREESLELYRTVGDREGEARALLGLGEIARCKGECAPARGYYEESLQRFRELGSRLHVAVTLHNLGHVANRLGDQQEALSYFLESLSLSRALGHKVLVAACLAGLGGIKVARGEPATAARLLGAAEHIVEALGTMLAAADRVEWKRNQTAAEEALGREGFAAARAEGSALTVEQALAMFEEQGSAGAAQPVPGTGAGGEPQPAAASAALTPREAAVLKLLADGLSYADIGRRLSISHRTVDAHLRSIYAKLNVRSRHEAVQHATRHQLI